ncbi:nitroreductase [Cupriavidus oxalaticus]|uniref:nitroreductase n=1 Tax=Cupriavidus oxalaticus TaxID=96344 RepID=UPI003180E101
MQQSPASAPSGCDVDTLARLMSERYTCRAYLDQPVPESVIRSIVSVAKQSASWCNVQPWHLVIGTAETTERFRGALVAHAAASPEVDSDLPFPEEYRGVHAQRRQETGHRLYEALGIERHDRERRASQGFENFRLFGAPHVAIVTMAADLGPYAAVDCGGFIASFLLAAHAHGVATTPQGALARHAGFVRSHFGIGDDRKMICAISFGYADPAHAANGFRTTRAPDEEIMRLV